MAFPASTPKIPPIIIVSVSEGLKNKNCFFPKNSSSLNDVCFCTLSCPILGRAKAKLSMVSKDFFISDLLCFVL
jgi:hypothetical protein